MKKRRGHRFFWLGIFCCLCLWSVAAAVQAQPQGDVAMPANSNEAGQDTEKKAITVPLTLELIGIDLEKRGIYRLQLGFQPGTMPLPAFEQSLRTDYGGEVEIFLDGELYKRLRYEDHAGFAPTPVGNGYGPVYYFAVDVKFLGASRQCDLYPKIRAKKPCGYSLSISRERYSWAEKIGHLFRSPLDAHKTPSDKQTLPRPEMQHQALVERIDILTEKRGNHGFDIGFHKPEGQDINKFSSRLLVDFAGTVEIWRDGRKYMVIDYYDTIGVGHVGYKYLLRGLNYLLKDVDIGWYSFNPKIMSFKEGTFGFDIHRSYTSM